MKNKKKQVTEVIVTSVARSTSRWRMPWRPTASRLPVRRDRIRPRTRGDQAQVGVLQLETVTLVPKKPFALNKKVQLVINGEAPNGLQDSLGRLIDGNDDGQAGGNATAILSQKGATIAALSFFFRQCEGTAELREAASRVLYRVREWI